MIWFTSDTHFGHKNIIKYSGRPYCSLEEMDNQLVANWNRVVKASDKIYHLGDIAFCKNNLPMSLSLLNGQVSYLYGNHSKGLVVPNEWVCLGNYHELDYNGIKFVLNHYSQRVWNKSHYGSIHLYGHSHGELPPLGRSVDVGVDSSSLTGTKEYRPFSIDEVLGWAKLQPMILHHMREPGSDMLLRT